MAQQTRSSIDESKFPEVHQNRALLLIDLQDEFLSDTGRLKVSNARKVIKNVADIVPQFRDVGDVIWVKTERRQHRPDVQSADDILVSLHEEPKDVSSLRSRAKDMSPAGRRTLRTKKTQDMLAALMTKYDVPPLSPGEKPEVSRSGSSEKTKNEEFLGRMSIDRGPACCVAGSTGVLFAESIEPLIDRESDMVASKHTYSAFRETSLLPALRGGLITELYIAGAITNIQVFATVLEAVAYGFSTVLIEDCLGFNYQDRHDEAMKQMCEGMGAEIVSSSELVSDLTHNHGSLSNPVPATIYKVDEVLEADEPIDSSLLSSSRSDSSPIGDSVLEVSTLLQQISLKDPTWVRHNLPGTMKSSDKTEDKTPERARRSVRTRTTRDPPSVASPPLQHRQQSEPLPRSPQSVPPPKVLRSDSSSFAARPEYDGLSDAPSPPSIPYTLYPNPVDPLPTEAKTVSRKGARRSLRS